MTSRVIVCRASNSGLSINAHKCIEDISHVDINIVPSFLVLTDSWVANQCGALSGWFKAMHSNSAILYLACLGIFLAAETGLFDGIAATVHWVYAEKYQRTYPGIPVTHR